MITAIRMGQVVTLAALMVLALGSAALAQSEDELVFDEDQCEEVEIDGEVVLLCEDDEGTLWVCFPVDDNAESDTPNGDADGEFEEELLECFEVDEFPDEDLDDVVAPVDGVDTGAGGTAPSIPGSAAVAGVGLLTLVAMLAIRLRRSAN